MKNRLVCIFFRCRELKLIDRCVSLSPRDATVDEILTKHTKEHYDLLKTTSDCSNEEKLEELSSKFDAIYIHPVSRMKQTTNHSESLKIVTLPPFLRQHSNSLYLPLVAPSNWSTIFCRIKSRMVWL